MAIRCFLVGYPSGSGLQRKDQQPDRQYSPSVNAPSHFHTKAEKRTGGLHRWHAGLLRSMDYDGVFPPKPVEHELDRIHRDCLNAALVVNWNWACW